MPADVTASLVSVNAAISEMAEDSALSRQELDQLHTTLKELGNNTADKNIKSIVAEALALVDAARQAFAQVDSLDTALRNIPRDVQIRLQVSQEFSSSMSDLGDLYVDPRSRFEVARENAKNLADQATATASSYGDLVGVGEEYERVLSSINKAESEASAKTGASGAKAAAKAAQKPFDQWESAAGNFQKRIDQAEMEASLLGQSTFEIERQKSAFDLLNQAKDAGIPITDSITSQISTMSAGYATATQHLERMTQAANDNAAIWSQAQDGVSGIIKTWARGGDVLAGISDKLLNIADMLVDMAVRDLFEAAMTGGGAGGGGGLFGWLGSLIGLPSFAGGGSTGGGSRSGGMDGQGGYLALVHPQETIIDHTQPMANSGRQSQQAVHVTVGVAADGNGNILPFVQSVSQQTLASAAPAIVGASVSQANKSAPAAVAKHQQQRGGSDYRTM